MEISHSTPFFQQTVYILLCAVSRPVGCIHTAPVSIHTARVCIWAVSKKVGCIHIGRSVCILTDGPVSINTARAV